MNRYSVVVNGKEVTVSVIEKNGSTIKFEAQGTNYEVDIKPLLEKATAPTKNISIPSQPLVRAKAPISSRPGDINAPMPGIIVNVAVCEGDAVQAGQTILVIEAMKMENNIPAPKSGTIKKVHIKPQQQVENGQLLVQIE